MDADLVKGIGVTLCVAGVVVALVWPAVRKRLLSSMSDSISRLIVIGCLVVVVVAGLLVWTRASSLAGGRTAADVGTHQNTSGAAVNVTGSGNRVAIGRQPGGDTPADTGFDVANPGKKN